MKKIINSLIGSFDNKKENGFSARKLTAFALMVCIAYVHFKWVNHDNVAEVLIIDLCGVLILLGLITAEQVIKLKNGSQEPIKEEFAVH
jgi:hypothetical protein